MKFTVIIRYDADARLEDITPAVIRRNLAKYREDYRRAPDALTIESAGFNARFVKRLKSQPRRHRRYLELLAIMAAFLSICDSDAELRPTYREMHQIERAVVASMEPADKRWFRDKLKRHIWIEATYHHFFARKFRAVLRGALARRRRK
ncbi:MAG TPA: hypothetical protein VI454_19340 [Verrucomicrobiae bacterium]|jgi:hypothetical protein